jgi:hypothetical protein
MARATLSNPQHKTKYIKPIEYSVKQITLINPTVTIKHDLPFRVRFKSIQIEGYSASNPPPIPLQVIGFSNWIL